MRWFSKKEGLEKEIHIFEKKKEVHIKKEQNTATKGHSGTGGFPCFAFWSVQPKPLKLGSMLIPHFKALICGYLLVKRSKG